MLRLLLVLALAPLAACASDSGDAYADDMRREHDGETPVASGATDGADALDVTETAVVYGVAADGDSLRGTFVVPAGGGDALPGLIVIHEWWGLNRNVIDQARRLANEGYAALAVDLYGGASADTPDGAQALMQAAEQPAMTDNLRQGYAFLEQRGAPRIGSVGWCFGGGQSLQAALALPTALDAAVMYYGQPVTDADALRPLQLPVLALFGADDASFPPDVIEVYPGADHAFANPSGERYQPAAAADAWTRTTAFLAEHLR